MTAFVRQGERVLLLRRSSAVGTYRGKWAAVSGYLEDVVPVEQARIELREELGLGPADVILRATGTPLPIDDRSEGRRWLVHPFGFELRRDVAVHLDWEHVEMRWTSPEDIGDLDTVPGLFEAWTRVRDAWEDEAPVQGEPA